MNTKPTFTMKTVSPSPKEEPASKPIPGYTTFLDRLQRLGLGAAKHRDQKATTACWRKMFTDRMVSSAKKAKAKKLRDKIARTLILNKGAVPFMEYCFIVATEDLFDQKTQREFLGHLANALHQSKYRDDDDIKRIIRKIKPDDWTLAEEPVSEAASAVAA